MNIIRFLFIAVSISCCCATCRVDGPTRPVYATKHVVILVIDGPRYSETWGDSNLQYIPFRANTFLQQGVFLNNFRNNGNTWTSAGHAAISTGIYEPLENSGNQLPAQPSFFQHWRKETGQQQEKAWIITSKDKLYVLANCSDNAWQNQFMPAYDCGVSGPFSGYRNDSATFARVIDVLSTHEPDLLLINFAEPDVSAHTGNWNNYLAGIQRTDQYADSLWNFLQHHSNYSGTTTLIITNDHGRHLDSVADGFTGHGDDCEGCRHIEFIAAGPDFKQGATLHASYEQVDIPKTVACLMGFTVATGGGKVMRELFR
ncbi:MAG TPA: sulfatase-like hydrolase/transferase [Bacteroidia bacterium]|nr:sulfatase-like hydrolase/transferase [Bacteroidia bacterium]